MADDNNFSLGDILWEYADYTPEDDGEALPSAPAPVQPLLTSPAPAAPPADGTPLPEPAAPPGEVPAANAAPGAGTIPPANMPVAQTPPPQAAEQPPAQEQTAPPAAPNPPETQSAPEQTKPLDEGEDLIFFSPDPNAPEAKPAGEAPQTPQQSQAAPDQKPKQPQARPASGQAKPEQTAQQKPASQAMPAQAAQQPQQPQQTQPGQQEGKKPGIHLKTERKKKAAPEPPPDIGPAQLSQLYSQGLGTARARCVGGVVLSVMLLIFALLESGFVAFLRDMLPESFYLPVSLALFVFAAIVCQDVLKAGLIQLTNKAPDADTLALFATAFTVLDGLTLMIFHLRTETLPFFAPCAVMLTFHQIGHTCGRAAKAMACETAAAVPRAYVVTQDPNVIGAQTAFRKWLGDTKGFGSQMRTPSGPYRQFQRLTPVLIVACFLVPLITTVLHHQPRLVFWSLAGLFTTASTLGAALAFDLPFRMVAGRMRKQGAALAGWPGIDGTRGCRSILLGDYDLYPPGAVNLIDARALGGSDMKRAVSLAASAIRASGSGLGNLFERMRQKTGGSYVTISKVEIQEQGIVARGPDGAVIQVGNWSFMRDRGVPLPQDVKAKDAVFCAHGLQPVGVFFLRYDLHPAVIPCIQTLLLHKMRPIIATRDFNLSTHRLRVTNRLPLEDDSFPDLGRRVSLSDPRRHHGSVKTAYLTREGILSYTAALTAARRVRRASLLNSWFVRIGAVVGVFLAATLSSSGATGAMCAWNLAIFLLLWLVPVVLLSFWASR